MVWQQHQNELFRINFFFDEFWSLNQSINQSIKASDTLFFQDYVHTQGTSCVYWWCGLVDVTDEVQLLVFIPSETVEGKRGGRAIKMSDFQERQFISQLSWNMTGCWWMKQEGRGAPVWQVVSGFMECLQRRAEQSGVPHNGHVFHLTLATWEGLTFNFGFYICRWLQCVTVMHKLAPPSFAVKMTAFYLKWLFKASKGKGLKLNCAW